MLGLIESIVCILKNNSANLYAGCGNGEIYGFDLETSQFTVKLNY